MAEAIQPGLVVRSCCTIWTTRRPCGASGPLIRGIKARRAPSSSSRHLLSRDRSARVNLIGRMNGLLIVLAISAVAAIGCASSGSPTVSSSTLGITLRSSAVTVEQAGTATVEVDLVRTNYAKSVTVTLAGLDAAEITADALVIDPSSSTGTLRLHASATALDVTATGTVQGNGGDASASLMVTVRARAAIRPLALAVTPHTLTLQRGGQATIQVDLTRINYPNPVTIAVDGLAAAGIDSTALQADPAGDTAFVILFASPTALLGTTAGTVQANGGDASAPLTVTVVPSGAFSL